MNKIIKIIIILIAVSVSPILMSGQTDIQSSLHMFSRTTYNPAVTGASRYINIYGHWRDQWQGFTGAPQTMYFGANSYFNEIKSGMGLVAIKDKIGFENNMIFKVSYAYHISLSSNSYISLGLSGGVLNRNIDWTKQQIAEPDSNLPAEQENKWNADFDFGVEYNMERFTLGLSITHLNRSASKSVYSNMGHHFYGYIKYKFALGVDYELVPSLFMQNNRKSTHVESNLLLYYRNRAWVGASYRMDDKFNSESVVGMVGIDLMNSLRISYSFDYNIGKIGKYANNTHEIMLGIRLNRQQKMYSKSPRFFE